MIEGKKTHGFNFMNVNSGEFTRAEVSLSSLFPYSKLHYSSKVSGCSFQQGKGGSYHTNRSLLQTAIIQSTHCVLSAGRWTTGSIEILSNPILVS